jgi:polysaccharide biosynthesis protein PelB
MCSRFVLLLCGALPLTANALETERDYHSAQLASGDKQALVKLVESYRSWPHVRIEKRGEQYTLRAGFWTSRQEAKAGLSRLTMPNGAKPLLRLTSYRPELMVKHSEGEGVSEIAVSPAPTSRHVAPTMPHEPQVNPTSANTSPPLEKPARQSLPFIDGHSATELAHTQSISVEDYQIAFDAFLAAGDQQRAFALARKAVAAYPNDSSWRLRLARLSEWTQRVASAWEQWAWLYAHGDDTAEVLNAVLRLAPSIGHPDIALKALARLAQQHALSDAQWQDMRSFYESAGKQAQGAMYFEQQAARHPAHAARFMEWAALLAEHSGDDSRALHLHQKRLTQAPFSSTSLLGAVSILLRHDRLPEAMTLLQSLRARVPDEAQEYWRLLASVAWDVGDESTARDAYARYTQTPDAPATDWSRLIGLTRTHDPAQAAELARLAWLRHHDVNFLLQALSLYAERNDRRAQTLLFSSLNGEALKQVEANSSFLVLRANWHQAEGRVRDAERDIRQALSLDPGSQETQISAFWLLMTLGEKTQVSGLLERLKSGVQLPVAASDPRPAVLATGYQWLGRPRAALAWFRTTLEGAHDDPLVLLNYADALESAHHVGMAERVRRHAFLSLRARYPKAGIDAPLNEPALQSLARLHLLNATPDAAQAALRTVVARLRRADYPADYPANSPANVIVKDAAAPETPPVDDLILSWALSTNLSSQARTWMWLRQARYGAVTPIWAEGALALQTQDRQTAHKLLGQSADAVAQADRHDATIMLDDWPRARAIAFSALDNDDANDAMHERLLSTFPTRSHYLQVGGGTQSFGTLERTPSHIEGRWQARRDLALTVGWRQASQSLDDLSSTWLPGSERVAYLDAQWSGERHNNLLGLSRRDEFAQTSSWRFKHDMRVNKRVNLSGEIFTDGESDLTTAMRLAGMADGVNLTGLWQFGQRERLSVSPRWQRLKTQNGDDLGSARMLDVELTYQFRIEYPDTRLRAIFNDQRITADGEVGPRTLAALDPVTRAQVNTGAIDPLAIFLPESSRTSGLCFGMGENVGGLNLREGYTRIWRPFYDVCATNNNLNGAGHTFTAGVAGPVMGNDHLLLNVERGRGGSGSGADTHEMHVRYRHYF